jgi:predicted O-methyltransferase YrrM
MSSKLHYAGRIDHQAKKSLLKPDADLDNAIKNSASQGLPAITINPLQGQYLSIQATLLGAKNILEIGTLGGYSTLWFAKTGAKVTSIEINSKHRDVALQNTEKYKDSVDIILGAALDVLPNLAQDGREFDFVFIDAAWDQQWEYFQWAVKLVRKGGAIYVDNVIRELLEHEDLGESGSLVTKVGTEKGVRATVITTISSHKGNVEEMMDGFLLAVKL